MKNIIRYNPGNRKNTFVLLIFFALVFSISTGSMAQTRGMHERRGGAVIRVHGHGGFGSAGHRFRFVPPIGTRIRVLPVGFSSFWIGGLEYYYYGGIYYRFFPADGVYVVVEKPAGEDKASSLKFDQLIMYDGSTMEGVFEGATDSTVTLLIGNKNKIINIGDIVTINFAPSIQKDSTIKK